jgi:DNA invertase Pin-like site-specific DNA recombinase
MNHAIYLRVSTAKQGTSGLGLDAQRAAIAAAGITGTEFVEVESGRNRSRLQLAAAIAHAKKHKSQIVVAKLDRLARDVEFLFRLQRDGVDLRALDCPDLGNTLTLGMMATMGQYERELISERTKKAMDAKKQRDGEWRVGMLTMDSIRKGWAARTAVAMSDDRNRRAAVVVKYMQSAGASLRVIAGELNSAGFVTRNGKPFAAESVRRLSSMFATA